VSVISLGNFTVIEFDSLTWTAIGASVVRSFNAWRAAETPQQPWPELPVERQLALIAMLLVCVGLVVLLLATGRILTLVVVAAGSLSCYLIGRYRRAHLERSDSLT
jgi:Flp pilus assembly protein TadB